MRSSLIAILVSAWGICSAQLSDKDYTDRLLTVQKSIPLEFNDEVKSQIQQYIGTNDSRIQNTLNLFAVYEEEFKEVFATYNVPEELRFASISLTDFDNYNGGYQGRQGVFNLTYRVAKKRGLNITNYVDERRNITKAAAVFCQEISSINQKVNNWQKALIIYGSSDLDWQRARIMSKDSTDDIWQISKYLKSDYSKILPKFIAAVYFGNYYEEHSYTKTPVVPNVNEVAIEKPVSFTQIGKELDIDVAELKILNPIFTKAMVPKSENTYTLNLPYDKIDKFYELGDSIYGVQPTIIQNAQVDLSNTRVAEAPPKPKTAPKKTHATLIYRVKSGDNLILIADIYDITVSSLKAQNGLRSSRINVDKRLYVKVPMSKKAYYMKMNRMSMAQKKVQARRD